MIQISYVTMVIVISIIWLIARAVVWVKNKKINWLRELQLLLVYICIIVVVRFTFCPFGKVNGQIQPLLFDASRIFPPRINLIPFVYMVDYVIFKEAVINFVGNIAMFIPIGIIYPIVYKQLNTHAKVIAAGVGFSLCIEILQIPFFDRVTDIDDLLMNSAGYIIGYGIYLLVKAVSHKLRNR
ncbi:MAG: VanZ family protein [Agathobacter sp.]|nr:VanZ family protein [Agathobacter sp.]